MFTPHRVIHLGRIYQTREGELVRVIGPDHCLNGSHFRARGCTKATATPYNHYKPQDLTPADMGQVNRFLESEMREDMTWRSNQSR